MPHITRKIRRRTLIAAVLGLALFAGSALWQASRSLRHAAELAAAEGEVAHTSAYLDPVIPAGFEALDAPAVFRDAVPFGGHLYLCGPAGLFQYTLDGTLSARYAVGLELPPAPLVRMAPGLGGENGGQVLWIATAGEGLLAFDGRRFRQIRPKSPEHRSLTAVLPLAGGRVLIGTEKSGLLVYDGTRLEPFHPAFAGLYITALAGGEADFWAGTIDRGVLHWRAGEVHRFSEPEGIPDRQVLSLAVAGDSAFAGTAMGVAEFRGGRFHRVLAEGFFARALLPRGRTLAVGTLEEGVVEVPLAVRPPRSLRERGVPVEGAVEKLFEDGGKLLALAEDGIYDVQAGGRRILERRPGRLADRNISALAVDAGGRLWVGYFDRGLEILAEGGGPSTHIEDGNVFCVNRIVHDRERGVTAVATANGLVLFDAAGSRRQLLGRAEGLIANHVTDVVLRPQGMAVATPAGISFLERGGARSIYAFHGLVNNHVYALAAAGDRLLAGTLGGLSVVDRGVVSASYTTSNSALRHNWITAIAPVDGEFFVGTYGAGILRYDAAGHWSTFQDLPRTFEVNPNAMLATASAVYAGSLGRGLYLYHRASNRWKAVAAGLPSANVTALAAHGGYLYIGTDNGLVRASESSLQ